MKNILIINGPNLSRLGRRQPEIYGSQTMDEYLEELLPKYAPDVHFILFESNAEGAIIDRLYKADDDGMDGIVMNAGAYSHTSLAIADAIAAISVPVVEVHISNIFARETMRHTSVIAPVCRGMVAGFGMNSYRLAIESLLL